MLYIPLTVKLIKSWWLHVQLVISMLDIEYTNKAFVFSLLKALLVYST